MVAALSPLHLSFLLLSHLKRKELVLQLGDWSGLVETERLGGLLDSGNHGRRTADEDLDVFGGLGEVFLSGSMLVGDWRSEVKCVVPRRSKAERYA
jgi:hypothetical protein